jgi:hypothetical protein
MRRIKQHEWMPVQRFHRRRLTASETAFHSKLCLLPLRNYATSSENPKTNALHAQVLLTMRYQLPQQQLGPHLRMLSTRDYPTR